MVICGEKLSRGLENALHLGSGRYDRVFEHGLVKFKTQLL